MQTIGRATETYHTEIELSAKTSRQQIVSKGLIFVDEFPCFNLVGHADC